MADNRFPGGSAFDGELGRMFAQLKAAAAADPWPSYATRRARLVALERLLRDNAARIEAAIDADFGHRSAHETRLLEMFPSLEGIRHARRNLRRWMRPERRPTGRWFLPGRSSIVPQPLGVAGIIVPWNYPLFLAAGPMVGALAAGNRVALKTSEFTPRFGALFRELVAKHLGDDVAVVVEGDAEVGRTFSGLPFDHLLFTGSTAVGHHVMRAAADNLTPVTLELGGKSPAIVAPGYPLERAAERIVVGKTMNAGQTCIAPDYALVPKGAEQGFVAALRATVDALYPDLVATPDYTHVINERHFARLAGYIDEAAAAGVSLVPLSGSMQRPDAATRRMPPLALINPPDELAVMRDEIFGPLLPVIGYDTLDEAIRFVNARPRPLALYYFDEQGARIERMLQLTHAGGVTLNDTILHIAQDELPFGGVGASGMGAYHGKAGFDTFSKLKPVFRQSRLNGLGMFKPPYGHLFDRLVAMLMRG
ncbi:MAG TPA: coniferyl aldehyde dehydrogenase [Rhodocyclaceae bacterium]|nr:coniferyl aldehyde dehydrogenase [Rhodocyclaceae bacterium]HMV53477.1 coniferyl aldehyde dehydrogenase [Rhodocyclaceae bacterium]HMZ84649.1 coniferyl aldehyde dehydrogenase [Rhodocyclaceae bacterium]HNA04566.1 coniferyl aldehyde dehydrogenase [Rhodocyclaceae bacterium]HNB79521.1 coniferyl aldehyde dehydrogenase [Rhodocyclaceae bacterium]